MALSKVDYNSLNVTAAASKALKWNSGADGFETGDVAGALVLLETQTADDDSTITFDSNIDSTYKEYIFKLIDIHPANDDVELNVNFRDGSTAYDATKTSSCFSQSHYENDQATYLQYDAGHDLAQATGIQPIVTNTSKGSIEDGSVCGTLHLFNPSSTTFVTHYMITTQFMANDGANAFSENAYTAGYCNVTAAIDGVQFAYSAGNIDAGTFKMYGVK